MLTGIRAGVKKQAGVPDLSVILSTSEQPTSAAAFFARNVFKAAPVLVSDEVLKKNGGWAKAVVVNSGCANAITGKRDGRCMGNGESDRCPPTTLFRIRASNSRNEPKQLHATLLGCILTDAAVSPRSLQNALMYAVDRSFNSISVDGDVSTNDSIYALANGAAKGPLIDEETDKEAYEVFKKELTDFAADLAQLVVRDGEGATKFVTVTVKGAPSYRDAHNIASRISTSALVKTALYGEDAK